MGKTAEELGRSATVYPPGPKGALLFGNLLSFLRDPLGFLLNAANVYGDVVHFKLGPTHMFLLNHPDYIKDALVTENGNFTKNRSLKRLKVVLGEGLLTSEGAFWRRQRRLAQPAFHRQSIGSYGAVMVAYARRLSERWQDGDTLDIAKEMMRLTLAIVGKTLFDADVEADAEEVGQAMRVIQQNFNRLLLPYAELTDNLPLPANIRLKRAIHKLDAVIYRLIAERRAGAEPHRDLLSLLLLAQDEESDGGSMTDQQLRDEALTIFLAGYGTTASALTWTWGLLSQHTDVEARLHEEIDRELGDRPAEITDLPRLSYCEMVFSEAMRLYPPAWIIGRRAINDYAIGRYQIPAGSDVLLSPWVTHHDERYYPDPFRFDPLRWTPEARESRPKFSYFPFGGGSRVCIGEGFARMEGALILATLAQRWRLRLVPGQKLEPATLIALRPRHGLLLKLERRSR
jgi:cytochrome P450